jgi:hypothetical protein
MSKNAIIFIVIILVLIGGYFLFIDKAPEAQVEEVQNGAPIAGKIDINAVCEGALAYMTFENGQAAEQFVAECKDGQHPEVIDKWKADNNIGDDQAI